MQRDSNGYVIDDLKSCGPFDDDGNYNGLTCVIEDHLGWFSNNVRYLSPLFLSKTLKITTIPLLAVIILVTLSLKVLLPSTKYIICIGKCQVILPTRPKLGLRGHSLAVESCLHDVERA